MWLFEGYSYCMIFVRMQLLCNMPKWFMMQRRKRGFDKLLLLKNIWSRSFNCCWTLAFSSRLIYLTSHQAKWQPICILITVLCLQSTANELLHIVCLDIFAARNLFSLGVFPKPMQMVSEQLVQFKQELHKQSACWLSMILVWKTSYLYLLIDDCWMATTLINSFMIDEGGSQLLRCYHLTNCWRNDLAGEIDSIVKSSSFMVAQKLECEPEKSNRSLLSNAIHCTTQTAKIDLSEFHGLICGIEFAIYAREVFWKTCIKWEHGSVVWQIMSFSCPHYMT